MARQRSLAGEVTLAAKLQLKPGTTLATVNAPDDAPAVDAPAGDDALLLYARDRAALDAGAGRLGASAGRGALTWVAYPKAGKLGTDLNRDRVHEAMRAHGLETVRQVALDDTWSALRLK
jgi:hypothetical protein